MARKTKGAAGYFPPHPFAARFATGCARFARVSLCARCGFLACFAVNKRCSWLFPTALFHRKVRHGLDRYKGIPEEEKQDEFKKGLRSWTNLYAFLSQIMPFTDSELEKFYAYAKLLQTRLPKRELSESLHLDDEVALEYYRLQKIKDGAIELQKGEEGELSGTSEAGLKRAKDEDALLSEIIHVLNDRFGTEFEPADQLLLDSVEADLLNNLTFRQQARVNKMDTFKYAFDDKFDDAFIGRMEQNKELFEKVFDDAVFGGLVRDLMMRSVYKKLNQRDV